MKSYTLLMLILFITFESMAQDTIPGQVIRVDTIRVERVRVDTIRQYIEVPVKDQTQKTQVKKEEQTQKQKKSGLQRKKMYFGGYTNFSMGKYTVIGVEPMVGYKITPKFSVGGKLSYEYVKNKRYSETYKSSNYGASIFNRWRIVPTIYTHTELSVRSYKLFDSAGDSERKLVPFFYVGGGYSAPVTKNTWFTAQVLFDVWQHKNSPYKAWEPYLSAGFGVGF